MCLTPLKIANPSIVYRPGVSRPILYVACGHCKECIKRQQDDWFIRSVFETMRVQSAGGAVWFPTLTYRNEDLPIWNDPSHRFSCPCFNVEHFKKFRDSLRSYLSHDLYLRNGDLVVRRRGSKRIKGDRLVWNGIQFDDSNTIRYFYACEYGSKRGRSHLHCLLYVPFKVKARLMHFLLDRCWKYGFVRWSKLGMIAHGHQAPQYCMKYLSKEMLWYKQYGVDDYLKTLHDDIYQAKTREDVDRAKELLKAFRRVTPGHKQSMGFGILGLDYFKDDFGSWDIRRLVDGRFDSSNLSIPPTKKGEKFMYNMPLYYVRKIFYDVNDWNIYRINDLGTEVFTIRFNLSLKRDSDAYSLYLDSPGVLCDHLAVLDGVDSVSVYKELTGLMSGRTAYDLALFNKVYRDVERTEENECYFSAVDGLDLRQQLSFFDSNALDFMLLQKQLDMSPEEYQRFYEQKDDHSRYHHPHSGHVPLESFNDLPCFSGFVDVLNRIEDLENRIGKMSQSAYVEQRLEDEQLFGVKTSYTTDYLPFNDL